MLLLSLVLCAPQFDLSQIEIDTDLRARVGHNSLLDTAGGTSGALSAAGVRLHSSATLPFNEYSSFTLAAYIYSDGFAADTSADFDIKGFFDIDQLWGDTQIRIGRMGLGFGDGRIISTNPWSFEENIHDAVLVQANYLDIDFDFFASRAVAGVAAVNDDQMFGLHGEYSVGASGLLGTYFFTRDQNAISINEYNLAVRWLDSTSNGLNYDLLLMLQNGEDGPREITSNAYVINLAKQLDFGHGLGVEIAVAQGDGANPAMRQRYSPVMIDYHRYNGRADILAFSNLMDFSLNYWLNWNERWAMHIDVHSFFRQSTFDGVYFGNDATFAAAANSDPEIAREVDFYLEGNISKNLNIDFGLSLFSPQSSIIHDQEQFIVFLQGEYSF